MVSHGGFFLYLKPGVFQLHLCRSWLKGLFA